MREGIQKTEYRIQNGERSADGDLGLGGELDGPMGHRWQPAHGRSISSFLKQTAPNPAF